MHKNYIKCAELSDQFDKYSGPTLSDLLQCLIFPALDLEMCPTK